ncbi:hypothetical protein ACVWWG_003861 [Bradyrhizobium sp. LB7.2]
MPDHELSLDPNTILPMRVETFAEFAVEAALWLVRESMNAIANKTDFDPDPDKCFRVLRRLPAIRELCDLTEEQRHDMFVEGFRHIPNGAQDTFELLLVKHKALLWEGFRQRWNVVAKEVSLA